MKDPHEHIDDRIGVLGDTHGDLPWTLGAIRTLLRAGVRQLHVLGDFGFVWHGAPDEQHGLSRISEVLAEADAHLLVTGGNHEGYAALERLYPVDEHGYRALSQRITWVPRGWRGQTTAGTVVASLGGANSIDRPRRKPPTSGKGGSWWPEEQITDADLEALGHEPVEVLLAHDAPRSQALAKRLAPNVNYWTPEGLAYADMGQQTFQRAVAQVRPKLVLSGHYHLFLDTTETFHTEDGAPFDTRSVVLDCNGNSRSIATLEVDSRTLKIVPIGT